MPGVGAAAAVAPLTPPDIVSDVERPSWAPPGIDVESPSAARIYDYHLGGVHNFPVDRDIAERVARVMPDMPLILRANRAFLGRAVRFLVDAGIRQFLDLGSGIPTLENVHQIAQRVVPDARVVYVDVDPVAVAHSRALLEGDPYATVVEADLRNVARVLRSPEVGDLIDFSQPVGVLMVAVLHFVSDSDDVDGILAGYRHAVVGGSHLVISHAAAEEDGGSEGTDEALATYSRRVAEFTLRTRGQVIDMFTGMDIVEPGVVNVDDWRPDDDAPRRKLPQFAGVARKPAD